MHLFLDDTRDFIQNMFDLGKYTGSFEIPVNQILTNNYILYDARECKDLFVFLDKVNSKGLFKVPHRWLLFLNTTLFKQLQKYINNYDVYPSSDFMAVVFEENNATLLQPYKINKKSNASK